MKQQRLNSYRLRAFLLVAMLVGAFTGSWAEEKTSTLSFTATCGGSGTANDGVKWAVTSDGTESNFDSTKGIHYGTGKASVQYIKLTTSDIEGTITKIVVNASTASGVTATVDVTVGGSAFGGDAQSLTSSASDYTFTGSASGEIIVTVTKPSSAAKALYVQSVVVTYTSGGGDTPTLKENDLALVDDPVELEFDLYNNATAQVINYTTNSTGALSFEESDYATFKIDEENKTITVTPKAATPEVQTITVNQAADDTYKAGSVTFDFYVGDSTPIPTHTVTFFVNGATSIEEIEEGADIEFPENPAAIEGKVFCGWITESIDGTTDETPKFVTSATMGQADVTYYAVFATKQAGNAQPTSMDIEPNTTNIPTSYAAATDYTLNGVLFNILQMFKNGSVLQWRAAGNANGTGTMYNVEALSGIKSIVLTYADADNNKNFTLKVGSSSNPTDGTTITPAVNGSVYTYDCASCNCDYFILVNGSGAGYLESIQINYLDGTPDVYSGYCTSVVIANVALPEITIAENPFLFSTTATITCETEGAAIKYSFDGENWNDYTEALTITETTTIYAKAVKDNDESNVAQATATKNLAVPTVTVSGELVVDLEGETSVEAGTLTAAVTYEEEAVWGAVVTWESSKTDVAEIDAQTGVVTIKTRGTVTFTATFAGNDDYADATGTMTLAVTDSKGPGAVNNPYTVAQAIAAIDAGTYVEGVYVKGVISQIDSYNAKYKSITYWISDDGTKNNQFEVYSGRGLGNTDFTNMTDIEEGAKVVIYGNIKKYGDAYEFDKENYLTSYKKNNNTAVIIDGIRQEPIYNMSGFVVNTEGYLYNVGSGKFFTQGNSWGTQASVGTEGKLIKFVANTSYDYTLLFYGTNYANTEAWYNVFFDSETALFVDRINQADYFFAVENNDNTFRIATSPNNPTFGGYADSGYYVGLMKAGSSTALSPFVTEDEAFVDWSFVTVDDYDDCKTALDIYNKAYELKNWINKIQELQGDASTLEAVYLNPTATMEELQSAIELAQPIYIEALISNAPDKENVDVTSALKNPDFEQGETGWTVMAASGDGAYGRAGNVRPGGSSSNQCYEAWNNSSFDIYQTLSNMPVGVYEIEVQGFYRYGRDETAWDAYLAQNIDYVKPEGVPVYIYLNNNATHFVNIFGDDQQITNSSFYGSGYSSFTNGSTYYFPNDMASSAIAFSNNMYKQSAFGLIANKGDAFRIGVKGNSSQLNDSWVIWDNFKLVYRGFKPEVVQPVLEIAINDLQQYSGLIMGKTEYNALIHALDNAQSAIDAQDGEAMFSTLNALYDIKGSVIASKDFFKEQEVSTDLANLQETLHYLENEHMSAATRSAAVNLMTGIAGNSIYEGSQIEQLKEDVNQTIDALYLSVNFYQELGIAIEMLENAVQQKANQTILAEANELLINVQPLYETGSIADEDIESNIITLDELVANLTISIDLYSQLASWLSSLQEMLSTTNKMASSVRTESQALYDTTWEEYQTCSIEDGYIDDKIATLTDAIQSISASITDYESYQIAANIVRQKATETVVAESPLNLALVNLANTLQQEINDEIVVSEDFQNIDGQINSLVAYWAKHIAEEDIEVLNSVLTQMGDQPAWSQKWNLDTDELILDGVTNTEGRVTAINLANRGLKGAVPPTLLNFEKVSTIDLSGNSFSEFEGIVPATISVNLRNQSLNTIVDMKYGTEDSQTILSQLPSILSYNSNDGGMTSHFSFDIIHNDWNLSIYEHDGTIQPIYGSPFVYKENNGTVLTCTSSFGDAIGTTFNIRLTFDDGDANLSGHVDVNDLQTIIKYIFKEWVAPFNYTSANLFMDERINVQDVVRLVDVLLNADEEVYIKRYARANTVDNETTAAHLFWRGNELVLSTEIPVAAADIRLTGNAELSWMLRERGFTISEKRSAEGAHAVFYSLSGAELPAGETILATKTGGSAELAAAMLSDQNAQSISTALKAPHLTKIIGQWTTTDGAWTLCTIDGVLVAHGTGNIQLQSILRQLNTGIYILQSNNNPNQKITIK